MSSSPDVASEATSLSQGDPQLLVERRSPVATITLNRPRQRNALSLGLLEDLLATIDRCAGDPSVRVVVLAGSGTAFSAGHDLREVQASKPAAIERLFEVCARVMLRIQEIPQPVIARVHGVATAAGCQLVAACDLAVASRSATFATPGVNIGLFCSTPAVPVVRVVGRKRAMKMLLTGDAIDADTALDWGLVNHVVADDELDATVARLVERISAASADTVALGKRAFYRQVGLGERDAYELASAVMCENLATDDAREGIAAFIEKRAAVWKPR